MKLDEATFKERLRKEPDAEYVKALLTLAVAWSQPWVIDALRAEIETRKHEWAVGKQHP